MVEIALHVLHSFPAAMEHDQKSLKRKRINKYDITKQGPMSRICALRGILLVLLQWTGIQMLAKWHLRTEPPSHSHHSSLMTRSASSAIGSGNFRPLHNRPSAQNDSSRFIQMRAMITHCLAFLECRTPSPCHSHPSRMLAGGARCSFPTATFSRRQP